MRQKKRKAISKQTRFRILDRDDFTCRYCGQKSPNVVLHVDHVKPVAKGGTNDEDNLVTACSACNGGKSDAEIGVNKRDPSKSELILSCINSIIDIDERYLEGECTNDLLCTLNYLSKLDPYLMKSFINNIGGIACLMDSAFNDGLCCELGEGGE